MRLGELDFDAATGELRRGEVVVRLEPQPAALLHLLLSRPGELVGHAEIREAVWGRDDARQFPAEPALLCSADSHCPG